MVFPDGVRKPIKNWNRIQAVTVEWLVETARLKELDCPLIGPRGNFLVHTVPYKRNGMPIRKPRQVQQFWIDLDYVAERQVRRAELILEATGVDPTTVYVITSAQGSAPLSQQHLQSPVGSHAPRTASEAAPESVGVSLSELRPGKGQRPKRLITFPDGVRKSLTFWYDLPLATVEWLVKTGRLTEFNCPVKTDAGAHIVHTSAVKQNGRPFDQPKNVGNYWIDSFPNAVDQVRMTNIVLRRCGVDPATIYVA